MKPAFPRLALAALVALGLSAHPAAAQDKGAAASSRVATVNGVAIPKARVDVVVKAQAQRGVPDSEQMRNEIKEQLIVREIIAQEAAKKGLAKNTDVAAQLDLSRQEVLWGAYIADFIKNTPISDAQIKAEYDRVKAQRGDKEYKARHILVEQKETAESVIRELQAGGDFSKIAAKESKDSSGKAGGDLGWFSPQNMVKPFSDAVQALEKGKYTTTPVQSEFGWHVIILDDVRSPEAPKFEDVKPQVEMFVQRKKLQEYLDGLRKTAKIQK